MIRRRHKKSRTGCLECKRRHLKCDERRPTCYLCSVSGRRCRYPSLESNSQAAAPSAVAFPSPVSLSLLSTSAFDDTVNVDHMTLLVHLVVHQTDLCNLAGSPSSVQANFSSSLQQSLHHPFLLYQMMAFSACHLAAATNNSPFPDRYRHQAVVLQTRAVSLFNQFLSASGTSSLLDQSNCAAALLFSALLGHHLLAETLLLFHKQEQCNQLDTFLDRYVPCMRLHRGIYTIATSTWLLLLQTEYASALTQSAKFTSRTPVGCDCSEVEALVARLLKDDDESRQGCLAALHYLQLGFDALSDQNKNKDYDDDDDFYRLKMIVLWPLLVPHTYTDLVEARRPEALIVLAYYALFLCYGRHLWQVRDAGPRLLSLIGDHLGPIWDPYLKGLQERGLRDGIL